MTPPSAPRLVTLTAIVVALAAAVGITGGGRTIIERPLVAPGLSPADVSDIHIARKDEPPIAVVVQPREGSHPPPPLYVVSPVPGPADEAAVLDLISAVATARADRSVRIDSVPATAGLDAPRLQVRIDRMKNASIEIAVGAAVPASGQVWLRVGDRGMLVSAWVAAALDRDLASLRRRQVFPPVQINGIEIHGRGVDLVLAGIPLYRLDEGTRVRVAGGAVGRLEAHLAAVIVDILRDGDTSMTDLTVRVLGGSEPYELSVHGPCPGVPEHVLVGGSAGVGCVRATIIDGVVDAAAHLSTPAAMERSLAVHGDLDIESIRAGAGADAVVLARRGAGWVLTLGDERVDADDDAVEAFFDALRKDGTPGPLPVGAPVATWNVAFRSGAGETWRWYERGGKAPLLVRRDDEPNSIIVPAETAAALRRLGPPLRNRTLLVVDAAMVNGLRATGLHPATLARGQLVGDWVVEAPRGATATPAAQALVELLAGLRATAWLEPRELGAVRRTLTFTIDAPPIPGGQPGAHTIAVGVARAGQACAARVDAHRPVELPAAACAALTAPLVR